MHFSAFQRQAELLFGKITKINEKVTDIVMIYKTEPLPTHIVTKLKEHYNTIHTKYQEYETFVNKLVSDETSEYTDVLKLQNNFCELYSNTKANIVKLLPQLGSTEADLNDTTVSHHSDVHKQNAKSPKLALPIFTSNLSQWTNFFHLFYITIHQNNFFCTSWKIYLFSCLKDELLGIISLTSQLQNCL